MTQVTRSGVEPLSYAPAEKKPRRVPRVLVWIIGIIVVGGMGVSVLLPSLCTAREPANRVKCAANLKQIGNGILIYAQENGGHFPSSLGLLVTNEDLTASTMICPSATQEASSAKDPAGIAADLDAAESNAPDHKNCLSYVYVGRGLTTATAKDDTIVAYEPLQNHDGDGANVLFGDGHVEFYGKQQWPKMAADAGQTVESSPTTRP